MKHLVIATFPAAEGKLEQLEAALKAALPDTRAFDGCIDLDVFQEEGTSTFTLIEHWESFDHYDKYMAWRMEGGLAEMLEGLLEGGAAGLKMQKLRSRDDI